MVKDVTEGASTLLGRDRELATAERAVRAALTGSPSVLVVTGDAGIGKSALVRAVVDRARHLGLGVGVGMCLDVTSHRRQGPVLEAMEQLGGATDATSVTELVHAVRERVGRGPVLVVVEDLQWAESGTRDVVRTLAHTGVGPLVLAMTVRTEDVPRSHPAGDLLRDVTRSPLCTVIDLGPLDEQAIHLLANQRLGVDPDPELVTRIHRRSEGNPLYAEELLDLADDRIDVPPRLTDLFLARVDRLREPAPSVLRAASVIGTRVDVSLVADATGLGESAVTAVFKQARDRQLVVVRDGQLAFRHALLRDALYEDLLPTEKRAVHGRVAETLRARSEGAETADMATLASLSFHAEHAGDARTALRACVEAGRLWRSQGVARGVAHLLHALELWDRVSRPEEVAGLSHAELLLLAGQACYEHGDIDEARSVLRRAVEEAEEGTDRLLLSRAYAGYVLTGTRSGDPLYDRALPAAMEAAGPGPSHERAEALIPMAATDFLCGRATAARHSAREILAIGNTLGDLALQAWGHVLLGLASLVHGHVRRGVQQVRRAIAEAARADHLADSLLFEAQLAVQLAESGRSEPALEVAEAAVGRARELRLPGSEEHALEQLAVIRVWRGELDSADQTLQQMRRFQLWTHRLGLVSLELLLARGDLDAASATLGELDRGAEAHEPPMDVDGFLAGARTELHLAHDDLALAAQSAMTALSANERSENLKHRAVVAAYGYLVLRALAGRQQPAPDALREGADLALHACLDAPAPARTEWTRSIPAACLLVARASRAALAGEPRPDLWQQATDVLAETGYVLWQARIQVHLAEDLCAAGERAAGTSVLLDTWHRARRMGADAVAAATATTARHHRIPLPAQPVSDVQARLTPREREVLALIEDGATNRQIAQALVISEKTVSVHVSSLLGKLGAAHRGEAAAMARRAAGH